ncbi:hypothetical protein F4V43_01925 [Paenibacillus spiritus]|uniref:Uncharacterized protein n=1 Tax=Paenibacillus spiritus TaxID=2496557 RepID=A0A5J5GHT9_9BACL|nr:hypothetical protein [Paenibacillus spiritus]KAA9007268.1 hypothetical protein F4V43_01925 [Paenibacillus spiritus]
MSKYSVTKDVSEVYRLRIDSHRCQWATITINNGDLNVISDCGNFNYSWRMNENENFKDLLIRICKYGEGKGYLYDKIHDRDRADRVDVEKTVKQIKKDLFEYYREKKRDYYYMTEDKYKYSDLSTKMRDAYDELIGLESEGEMSQDYFYSQLYNSTYLNEVFCGDYFAYLDVEYIGDRQAIAFCEVVAPIFAEVLINEEEANGNK